MPDTSTQEFAGSLDATTGASPIPPTSQPVAGQPPAPTQQLGGQGGIAHHILSGALSAIAGPGPEGAPRRGLAPILGGILSGALTGLSAGANRDRGEAGGPLAAIGRGFSAVQSQQLAAQQRGRAAKQQQIENQFRQNQQQMEQDQLDTEKQLKNAQIMKWNLDNIRAGQQEDLDLKKFQLENSKFVRDMITKAGGTLKPVQFPSSVNVNDPQAVMKFYAEHKDGWKSDDGTFHMYFPDGNGHPTFEADFDPHAQVKMRIGDYNKGLPPDHQMPGNPDDEVTNEVQAWVIARNKELDDLTRLSIDKTKAEAEATRAANEKPAPMIPIETATSALKDAGLNIPASWEGKQEVPKTDVDELLKNKRKPAAPSASQSVKTTEPTILQSFGNLAKGKHFNAPITTTTQTTRGPAPMMGLPPEGATHTILNKADQKMHWTDNTGTKDLGVVQ